MRRSALNASSYFLASSSTAPLRRAPRRAAKALSAALSALLLVQSSGFAWAAGDSATSAEIATFDDARPSAQTAAGDVGRANGRKPRGVPVSSSGTFGTSIPIDVPPGRAGLQPALALSYDSGSARPSAVGAGFSFGAPRIARSTKRGFPSVRSAGEVSKDVPAFAYNDGEFTSPSGDLVPADTGPTGLGLVYQAEREQEPVRYQYLPQAAGDATGGAWVEHLPSGTKRYYGRDPFTGREARISNELGTFAWPLLREEDADGNEVLYEYHGLSAAAPDGTTPDGTPRARRKDALKSAQRAPVLAAVRWGGNRKTALPSRFWVTTQVSHQDGPVDMASGGVVLNDRIDALRVGRSFASGPDTTYWTYALAYVVSADTGKLLLQSITRAAPNETPRTTAFAYSTGAVSWAAPTPLPAELEQVYGDGVAWRAGRNPFVSLAPNVAGAFDPIGFRSGTKFMDADGNGEVDAVYHPSGFQTTATHAPLDLARMQTRGVFRNATAADGPFAADLARSAMMSMIGDLDGDGDQDGLAFPLRFGVKNVDEDRFDFSISKNRQSIDLAHCTSPDFWETECKGVEPLSPWIDDTQSRTWCELRVTACMTPWLESWRKASAVRPMFVRTYPNASRNAGIGLPVSQVLDGWPAEVHQDTSVLSNVDGDSSTNDLTPYVESDFNAPLVDLNGDGKSDLVLLKHMQRWRPQIRSALVMSHAAITDARSKFTIRGGLPLAEPLSSIVATFASEAPLLVVDENLHYSTNDVTGVVVYDSTAGELGVPGVGPKTRVRVLGHATDPVVTLPVGRDRCPGGPSGDVPNAQANAGVAREDISNCQSLGGLGTGGGPIFIPPQPPILIGPIKFPVLRPIGLTLPGTMGGGTLPGAPAPQPVPPSVLPPVGPLPLPQQPLPITFEPRFGRPWRPPHWPYGIGDDYCGTLHWSSSACEREYQDSGPSQNAPKDRPTSCVSSYGLPQIQRDGTLVLDAARFVPHAYLSTSNGTTRSFTPDTGALPNGATADFSASLAEILNRGSTQACSALDCAYPPHVSWNAFFLDVNGDGLADLVVAEPPGGPSRTTCQDGHRVYLNRGYTFEEAPGQSLPGETWSSGGLDGAALTQLYNRNKPCAGGLNALDYTEGTKAAFPMGALAPVDINNDGLVDLVFARKLTTFAFMSETSRLEQRIFLNTGRGFAPAESVASAFKDRQVLPPVALGVKITTYLNENDLTPRPAPVVNWPDTARFVDLDGDGLEDIVQPGRCTLVLNPGPNPGYGLPGPPGQSCYPGSVYRNTGTIPDMITSVTTPTGAWTEVDYAAPTPALVTPDPNPASTLPVPSRRSWIVSKIRSAAGPRGTTAAGDTFPVLETKMHYSGYTRLPEASESLGYTVVVAKSHNIYAGVPGETVTVTETFSADPGSPWIDTPAPLKGKLLTTVTESGTTVETVIHTYVVGLNGLNGVGARSVTVRPRSTMTTTCTAGVCATSGMSNDGSDAFGYPLESAEGNAEGNVTSGAIVHLDDERRTTSRTYNHDLTNWRLGRVATEIVKGTTERFDGTKDSAAVLANRATTYDAAGHIATIAHKGITAAGCAGPADAVASFVYTPDGLVDTVATNGHAPVRIEYDSLRLFPTFHTSKVSRFDLDGKVVGTTDLKTVSEYDPRTGSLVGFVDLAGARGVSTYDSLGRVLTSTGPDGALREEHTYFDGALPRERTRVYPTAGGDMFERWTSFDGNGNALASVEGGGSGALPFSRTSRTRYDAFGRAVESYLPRFVASADDLTVGAAELRTLTEYDGLDRVVRATAADNTVTSTVYGPRTITTTNARGLSTFRSLDAHGRLIRVERRGLGGRVESSHQIVRDGLGGIVKIVDADGTVRRVERDGGGRVHRVEMPHLASATPQVFTACHGLDDALVQATGPDGRTTTVTRDELGRPLTTRSTAPAAAPVVISHTYDDPTLSYSRGRLSHVRDAMGDRALAYDVNGRESRLTWQLSGAARVTGAVAPSYSLAVAYDALGALHSATLQGGAVSTTLTYTRDAEGRIRTVGSTNAVDGSVAQLVSAVRYDASNRIVETAYGNGTYGAWDFNPATGNVDGVRFEEAATRASLGAVRYGYDANANPTREARTGGAAARALITKTHTFDALDRLASSTVVDPRGASSTAAFTYSPSGNLKTAGTATYSYERADMPQAATRVVDTASGTRTLGYDVRGTVTTDGARTLGYDASGCLASVQAPGVAATYVCNGEGQIAARRVVDSTGKVLQAVVSLGDLVEIRADEGVAVLRIPLAGTASVEQAFSLVDGKLVADKSVYLHKDIRGSVLATTAWTGAVISRDADYDAWGARIAVTSSATPRHGFLDHEPDVALGYYHFGARAYDPTLRRWLSADPLLLLDPAVDEGTGEELNLFQYARNNPVAIIDTTGMDGDGLLEKVQHAFIESRTAMGAAGFICGTLQGAIPGLGFLPPLPFAHSGPNTAMFRHWQGAGLMVGGTVAMTVGEGGEFIGIVATPATGGASLTVSVAGVVTYASGATAFERGLILHMENPANGPGQGPPASESPPAAQPTKPATPATEPIGPSAPKKVDTAPAKVEPQGASGGARAGKSFTPAGKAQVKAENAAANGGQTTCTKCVKPTVPAQQSRAGVTPPKKETNVDHVTAKSKGGNGSPDNGQVLCRECNLKKGAQ